jgi:stage IV sporulation protein FB
MQNKLPITVRPGFYLFLALSLLLLPIQWVIAWVLAITIHEICHFFALRACKAEILRIDLGFSGATIETDITGLGECLCALAGPLGSICLLFLRKWFPELAFCGLVQALFNFLPVFPLDGGRFIKALQEKYAPRHPWLRKLPENATLVLLFGVGLYGSLRLCLGLIPLLIPLVLLYKSGKIPCKGRTERVQ